jgi:acetoin utilization protein AcuB
MNVGRRMSRQVITVTPETQITKAHKLMAQEKIQQLPVVKNGRLVGILSERDILKAYPSSATTLSVWEITSLIERIKVKEIMIKDVLTVQEDAPIEAAARLMLDHKVSSLPVLKGEELVGIITETDLFNMMLEMLGGRRNGVYFSVTMPFKPGQIAKLTQAIYEKGGDIIGLGTFDGDNASTFIISAKIDGIEQAALEKLITPLVVKLLEIGTD